MFLQRRNRNLRRTESIRQIIRETTLTPADFMAPVFVMEGSDEKQEIHSMPGYYRYTLDLLIKEVKELFDVGVRAINPYVKYDGEKDNICAEAWNPDGLMQRTIREIKNAIPEMIIMSDVALDPYSVYGHDGIIQNGHIDNDLTVEALTKMSLSHAEAGVDFVAPSDMMDGRVAAFRKAFEENNYAHVGIMSYAAKYASCFYGPFRDALDSAPVDITDIPKDKKTYQMDPANRREAIKEALDDVNEGADMIMVKPAMAYLDILREVKNAVNVPVSAYQVSGEYAMIKAATQNGWLDGERSMMESLLCIKRAGADLISTYFAKEASIILNE